MTDRDASAESPEIESNEVPGAPALDPAAAAAAMKAADTDPALAAEASSYFRTQTRFVEIQTEHLHEQRAVNLSQLKLRRVSEMLKIGLQLFGIVIGTLIVVALLTLTFQAAHDRSLVMEPIAVPPDLQAHGVTGQVVAAELLDRLGAINGQASSTRAPSAYAANWGEEVKVEIPETGVSIGELKKSLVEWLGHRTAIGGEIVRTPGGITLTIRAGDVPGRSFSGTDAQLPQLLQQGAEAAFEATQPYRYSMYLQANDRFAEALAVVRRLAGTGDRRERAWAHAQISNLTQRMGFPWQSVFAGQTATRLAPDIPVSWFNIASAWHILGHDEESLAATREGLRALSSAPVDFDHSTTESVREGNLAAVDDFLGAFESAALDVRRQAAATDLEGFSKAAQFGVPYELARAHDLRGAAAALEGAGSETEGALVLDFWGEAFVPRYEFAAAREDWTGAAADMRATIAALPKGDRLTVNYMIPRFLEPRLAVALAHTGDRAGADAIVQHLARDCYRCLLAIGEVALVEKDWLRANAAFATAVRLAPSLPEAYTRWAEVLAMRGDASGARDKLETAIGKGPHFADAHEQMGELLLRQRDMDGAAAQFEEAAADAPHWARLHLRWSEALLGLGDTEAARVHFRQAIAEGINDGDRPGAVALAHRIRTGTRG